MIDYSRLQVQFDLHPTFATPVRVVETQPFEVTEHGWGEFDIVVHVSMCHTHTDTHV